MSQPSNISIPSDSPLSPIQRDLLAALLAHATPEQAAWLKAYIASAPAGAAAAPAAATPLTILFGSESGNAEGLADKVKDKAAAAGFAPKIVDMADLKLANLAKLENLLVIVSTWGEGDPPSRAEDFYTQFMGDKAPKLAKTRYSICALGDSSYTHFCKMGKDFDKRLSELGGERVYGTVECDVDFEGPASGWIEGSIAALAKLAKPAASASVSVAAAPSAPAAPAVEYGKGNPFQAPLISKVNLNGTGSAKETIHAEISLEGSGLTYEAGDALGLVPQNAPDLIEAFLKIAKIDGRENVSYEENHATPFESLLRDKLDLRTVSKILLQKYAKVCGYQELYDKSEDREWVAQYTWGRDWVDVVKEYPSHGLGAGDFTRLLRPLSARLYSIASSVKAHPGEVHLTVGAVRYEAFGRKKKGVCSTFLADIWEEGATAGIYFHHNKNFKLPADGNTPIIMVGPGTGIAPFRSFVEDRAADGAKGKNWLFFGDQHYTHDFLYQTEWQDYLKKGVLTKLDLAFSRDQPQKIYVQDKMRENAKEIWAWLDQGAYFYVCGDASRMAKDVHQALLDIIAQQGGKSEDDAAAYLKQMQKDRRYARDVY